MNKFTLLFSLFFLIGCGTTINVPNVNMECGADLDCTAGKTCRSKKGGGTECRKQESDESVITSYDIVNNSNVVDTKNGFSIEKTDTDDKVRSDNPSLTNHLQEEIYVGRIKTTIHNFCSPMLDECESWVTLKYHDQIIKKRIAYPGKLSKNEISQKGKYIAVESATGGNCFDCQGTYVFKLENEKILLLGYFDKIENDFLVSSYTDLEMNELTGHVDAPYWNVYYTESKGNLIIDIPKTCNIIDVKNNYRNNKKLLINEIILRKNKPAKKSIPNSYDEIYSLILSVLSFSKWCGWEEESLEIASKIKNSYVLTDYEKIQSLNNELNKVKKGDDSNILKKIKQGNYFQ